MELDRTILKKLWNGEKVLCPKCNEDYLIPLHKKKKDNDDFQCPKCKEVFRTITIFNKMLKDNKIIGRLRNCEQENNQNILFFNGIIFI